MSLLFYRIRLTLVLQAWLAGEIGQVDKMMKEVTLDEFLGLYPRWFQTEWGRLQTGAFSAPVKETSCPT